MVVWDFFHQQYSYYLNPNWNIFEFQCHELPLPFCWGLGQIQAQHPKQDRGPIVVCGLYEEGFVEITSHRKTSPWKRGWYGICLIYIYIFLYVIYGWYIYIYGVVYGIWWYGIFWGIALSPHLRVSKTEGHKRGSYDINHWASRWVAWDQNHETLNFKLPFAFDKRVPGGLGSPGGTISNSTLNHIFQGVIDDM